MAALIFCPLLYTLHSHGGRFVLILRTKHFFCCKSFLPLVVVAVSPLSVWYHCVVSGCTTMSVVSAQLPVCKQYKSVWCPLGAGVRTFPVPWAEIDWRERERHEIENCTYTREFRASTFCSSVHSSCKNGSGGRFMCIRVEHDQFKSLGPVCHCVTGTSTSNVPSLYPALRDVCAPAVPSLRKDVGACVPMCEPSLYPALRLFRCVRTLAVPCT